MDAENTRLDDALRAHARRSIEKQFKLDPDDELAMFHARLRNQRAIVRVEPSVGSSPANSRHWLAAAVAVTVVLVGSGALALTRDGVGRRVSSPSSTIREAAPAASDAVTTSSDAHSTRDSTPRATASLPAFSVGGGFNILRYPKVAFADSPAELSGLLVDVQPPIAVETLGVDWERYAVVAFARPTDACPSVFAGVAVKLRVLTPVFSNPGYEGCVEPLLSHTVLAAVDRDVLADVDRIELPAIPPYFDTPISTAISARQAPTASTDPKIPNHVFGVVQGSTDVPTVGDAHQSTLEDGSPIVVVHHHDDTITALVPWSDSAEPGVAPSLVTWIGATRTFLGNGAWDEYGRRLDGPRSTDLITFATRLVDGRVEIGDNVDVPVGSPIGRTTQPPTVDLAIRPGTPVSLTEALALPSGQTRWIDGNLVVDPSGAHLCKSSRSPGSPEVDPCPADAVSVEGVNATLNMRTVWFGPVLATRTTTGFSNVVPTAGSASSSSGEGLPQTTAP